MSKHYILYSDGQLGSPYTSKEEARSYLKAAEGWLSMRKNELPAVPVGIISPKQQEAQHGN